MGLTNSYWLLPNPHFQHRSSTEPRAYWTTKETK